MCWDSIDNMKRRREKTRHNAISPTRIKKIAEIACGWFRFSGKGWVRCDALDWPYCLYNNKPCSFWKPATERKS